MIYLNLIGLLAGMVKTSRNGSLTTTWWLPLFGLRTSNPSLAATASMSDITQSFRGLFLILSKMDFLGAKSNHLSFHKA